MGGSIWALFYERSVRVNPVFRHSSSVRRVNRDPPAIAVTDDWKSDYIADPVLGPTLFDAHGIPHEPNEKTADNPHGLGVGHAIFFSQRITL